MSIATHATRSTKLRGSGMNSVRSHMSLLRSLARRLGAVLTINMALLAELGLPAVRKDGGKVQPCQRDEICGAGIAPTYLGSGRFE
jgi:hypothetical protein